MNAFSSNYACDVRRRNLVHLQFPNFFPQIFAQRVQFCGSSVDSITVVARTLLMLVRRLIFLQKFHLCNRLILAFCLVSPLPRDEQSISTWSIFLSDSIHFLSKSRSADNRPRELEYFNLFLFAFHIEHCRLADWPIVGVTVEIECALLCGYSLNLTLPFSEQTTTIANVGDTISFTYGRICDGPHL